MRRRQLFALFSNGLVNNTTSYAVSAIIPIYFARLITDDVSIIGIYLALSFLTFSMGVIVGGWFSDRYPHRTAGLLISIVVRALFLLLHGYTTDINLLIVVSIVFRFSGGFSIALISTLTGLYAGENQRGMMFSIIWVNLALGALIGGYTSGVIVDLWGFRAFFIAGAVLTLVLQIPATLLLLYRGTATALALLATGFAIEQVGMYPTFLAGALLPVIAILFLISMHGWRHT